MDIKKLKSEYKLNGKYKIIKVIDSVGDTWYKIQTQGWFFKRWFRCWRNTDCGWTSFVPIFGSEEEVEEFLSKEHQEQMQKK